MRCKFTVAVVCKMVLKNDLVARNKIIILVYFDGWYFGGSLADCSCLFSIILRSRLIRFYCSICLIESLVHCLIHLGFGMLIYFLLSFLFHPFKHTLCAK